jgi:hypothetical protein
MSWHDPILSEYRIIYFTFELSSYCKASPIPVFLNLLPADPCQLLFFQASL